MSELYSLPKGWEWKKLEDLFTITSSKRVLKEDWLEKGIPFYRAREIVKLSQNGFVDNELFISEEMYNSFSKKYGLPKVNDILVTGVGTLGITYIVKENEKFYFKDGNIIWLKNDSNTNSKYIEYGFQTEFLKNQINSNSGSTVATYTITNANNTIIPIPPLEEQKRIVAKLDILFAKIDKAIALHQKNCEEADIFMASVLNDVFVELEEKYEIKTVDEVSLNVRYGYTDSAKDKGNAVFIRITDINENGKFKDNFVYVDIEDKELERFKLYKGDILVARSGATAGKVALFDLDFVSVFASYLIRIQPNSEMDSSFFFYFCHSPKYWEQLNIIKVGGAQPNVNATNLKEIKIATPPLQTQQKVVSYLDEVSQNINIMEQE